jgi:phosphatidylserine/phosphatidylglycerophosphate/cardiolipin synthase-like enzyme
MIPEEIDAWLARSLDDRRFSRGERQALGEFVATLGSSVDREALRRRAFEIAREALGQPDELSILSWLEDVTRTIREVDKNHDHRIVAEAYFSPGDDCPRAIGRLLANASKSADICVFTITDDRLAETILDAHRRRVAVRIITDDAKAEDLGSDVGRFEEAGIPTRVDRSPSHMHHKFAILDGVTLLTGSYNWTRGAARDNEENLIVTTDPRFLTPFEQTFDRLWKKLEPTR